MEALNIILLIGVLVFSIINIVSYFSDRSSIKERHAQIMKNLDPVKNLDLIERKAFEHLIQSSGDFFGGT